MNTKHNREAERAYARDAKALEPSAFRRLSSESRRALELAESQARHRDDNHVGTEHIVLGIYALGRTSATRALAFVGITTEIFAAQLEDEPGQARLERSR